MTANDDSTGIVESGAENAHSHNLTIGARALPADRHPAAVYLASLRPGSRRSTRHALAVVAQVLGTELELVAWHLLRYQHTQAVRASVADRYAPATANKILAALRGVLREARRLGLMSAEHAAAAADLPSVRGSTIPRGRALEADELRRLRGVCDRTTALGLRDLALLALACGGGLRRAELVGLDLQDLVGDGASELRVKGKGAKVRQVFLRGSYARDVLGWVSARGSAAGPLLCRVLRGGRVVRRRLTEQAILVALRRLAVRAGVAAFSPHDLRRTYISSLLDAGADIATVQRLAGHAQVSTTARYDRRGERAARAASELVPAPDG